MGVDTVHCHYRLLPDSVQLWLMQPTTDVARRYSRFIDGPGRSGAIRRSHRTARPGRFDGTNRTRLLDSAEIRLPGAA